MNIKFVILIVFKATQNRNKDRIVVSQRYLFFEILRF